MKIFKYRAFAVLSLGLFAAATWSACTDLEPLSPGQTIEATSSGGELPLPDDPAGVLESVRQGLNDFTDQGQMYALMEHTSDELMGPTRGTDWSDFGVWRQLHAHTWDPFNQQIQNAFNNLARRYFNATQVIAASDDAALTAEAQFLRAFFMSYMVDFFGQVPFREATEGFGTNPRVMTRVEATNMVIADLEAAINGLPSYDGNAGVATREAAQALLARVLLNKAVYVADNPAGPYNFEAADMDRVISLADEVMSNGNLAIQEAGSYFEMFGPENTTESSENIFALVYEPNDGIGGGVQNRQHMTTHYNQEVSGWNGFTTIADFYNKWDQNDERFSADSPQPDQYGLRRGFLQGQQFKMENGEQVALTDRSGNPLEFTVDVDLFYSNERMGVRVMKYYPDFDNGLFEQNNDYPLMRVGELVLNKAEAQLRKGDEGAAVATLNTLLANRAGTTPVSSLNEQTLLDHRGFEMYWEGFRRMDQIRCSDFLTAWTEKDYESPSHVTIFPIPQNQVDANPNLNQNPGY